MYLGCSGSKHDVVPFSPARRSAPSESPAPKAADIIELGAHTRMSAEDALAHCHRQHHEYSDVIVIGYDAQDGSLLIRSSSMLRKDALWMLEIGRLRAIKLL